MTKYWSIFLNKKWKEDNALKINQSLSQKKLEVSQKEICKIDLFHQRTVFLKTTKFILKAQHILRNNNNRKAKLKS